MSDASNLNGFAGAEHVRLSLAIAGSVALHLAVVFGAQAIGATRPHRADTPLPPLQAILVQPPPPAMPALIAPEIGQPATARRTSHRPLPPQSAPSRGFIAGDYAAQALGQVARNLLYPPEAIARGLEGEALVTVFLDERGNAVAARLERTSSHPILDDAAVRAANAVRMLPDGAPRELLLPVRFRLR